MYWKASKWISKGNDEVLESSSHCMQDGAGMIPNPFQCLKCLEETKPKTTILGYGAFLCNESDSIDGPFVINGLC